MERRYLNTRGHKALAQVEYANKRKMATLQYRVPAFAWLDGWYTASLPVSYTHLALAWGFVHLQAAMQAALDHALGV